ncbi:antibiotic biosynthesis monooxygenase [Ruegeria sp. ANG-R]|uniref:putative quinol monooxygenase n=1 Tax=Ruegeria sp. ANG-R TaxID=1577903 RepID=UPI0005802853|nr:putative quinol monooxygenase [Ruegeria sp. ANG-R]KIC42880.1 antibiotic biosynthesis monooxygenase [Ruegeria sp. ANG-R]
MTQDENAKVCLQGHIMVPAAQLDQVRQALPEHIALTRAEPGCLGFEVVEDNNHPGRFNVSEVFESKAAFDAHQERTRASNWFRITQGLKRHYSITSG